MTGINGLGAVAAPRTAAPRRAGPGGFRVEAEATSSPMAASAVSMPSLLGLQEAQGDAVADRSARRHAEDALDGLRELQLALLDGSDSGGRFLDQLTRRVPEAADPRLREVQRALLIRVAVEGARHKAAASL